MDTITTYRNILKQAFSDYARLRPSHGDIRLEVVLDETHDRYVLMHVGWDRGRRVSGDLLYVTLRDAKVHIEYDGMGYGISDDLVARGIPADHIVLTFLPETPTLADYDRREAQTKTSSSQMKDAFRFAVAQGV